MKSVSILSTLLCLLLSLYCKRKQVAQKFLTTVNKSDYDHVHDGFAVLIRSYFYSTMYLVHKLLVARRIVREGVKVYHNASQGHTESVEYHPMAHGL